MANPTAGHPQDDELLRLAAELDAFERLPAEPAPPEVLERICARGLETYEAHYPARTMEKRAPSRDQHLPTRRPRRWVRYPIAAAVAASLVMATAPLWIGQPAPDGKAGVKASASRAENGHKEKASPSSDAQIGSATNSEQEKLTTSFLVLDAEGKALKEGIKPDPNKPTFIVIHAFTGWSSPGDLQEQAKAWRSRYADVQPNVVVVKWDSPARSGIRQPLIRELMHYRSQVALSPEIGARIAGWMENNKVQPAKTVISGDGLGAHIAAFASNECLKTLGTRVHAIVATDPAGPLFIGRPPEQRLDKTDAERVIVVHTTAERGYPAPLGTDDLWVLSRTRDGGASLGDAMECHNLARRAVTEALLHPKNASVRFLAPELEFDFQPAEQLTTQSQKEKPRPSP